MEKSLLVVYRFDRVFSEGKYFFEVRLGSDGFGFRFRSGRLEGRFWDAGLRISGLSEGVWDAVESILTKSGRGLGTLWSVPTESVAGGICHFLCSARASMAPASTIARSFQVQKNEELEVVRRAEV